MAQAFLVQTFRSLRTISVVHTEVGRAPSRSPCPKFAIAKNKVQNPDLAQGKNTKYYLQKALASEPLPELGPCTTMETSDPPASIAALSVSESFCFSLWLCFSKDVCSVPNSLRTRNQRHDSCTRLDDTDKNFGPDLPLLYKMHEIWSVDSQENY